MSDTDMLYTAGLEAENAELKKLLRSIRSYYRENIAWVDLFEEDAQRLMGGKQNGTSAEDIARIL